MLNKAIIIVITTTLLLLWLYLPLASHFLRILRVKHGPKWGKVYETMVLPELRNEGRIFLKECNAARGYLLERVKRVEYM